jgi:hypothetical protein
MMIDIAPTLQLLSKHRDALLLAEVAAWLHMLGKYHQDFLYYQTDPAFKKEWDEKYRPNWEQKGYAKGHRGPAPDLLPPPDRTETLQELLTSQWMEDFLIKLDTGLKPGNRSISFEEVMAHHRYGGTEGFFALIFDAHGRGSATEKGALDTRSSEVVYLGSPFGMEIREVSLDEESKPDSPFYKTLEEHLKLLRDGDAENDWKKFRSYFLKNIERAFRETVAETRRPINDVTLYDQTASTVAFFKAALAQVVLLGWQDPQVGGTKTKYKWQLLRIGLNSQSFWGETARLNDMLSRKALAHDVMDKVKDILELEYPLGMEIYRDQDGSVFVLPEHDVLSLPMGRSDPKSLAEHIQEFVQAEFSGEASFELFSLDDPTRNMLPFKDLVQKALPEASPGPEMVNNWWSDENTRAEVCSVCGVRPQEKEGKAKKRKVCRICEERRTERAGIWAENQYRSTIWTDEVVDKNGRFALIAASFDLEHWLTGRALNSTSMLDAAKEPLKYNEFQNKVKEALQNSGESDFLKKILKYHKGNAIEIYRQIVEDTDLYIEEGPQPEAWRMVLALSRIQPSPARIRRIWETTRSFWKKCIPDIPGDQQKERLLIKGDCTADPGIFHAYELKIGNLTLPVVWDAGQGGFISVINLDYLAGNMGKPSDISALDFIQNKIETFAGEIKVEEPSGYGMKNELFGALSRVTCTSLPDGKFNPIIPILEEPGVFMALVPAREAFKIAEQIKKQYDSVEMPKVRNRLAMQVGVVFAQGNTPLRVLLDAGWRMLRKKRAETGGWVVSKCFVRENPDAQDKHWKQVCSITLKRDMETIHWQVPLMMGDGVTPDAFFPYAYVEKAGASADRVVIKSVCPWRSEEPMDLVHVRNLVKGDVIDFTPSSFDFQWLDSSARRFEIAYDANGKRMSLPRRPYLLDEFQDMTEIWSGLSHYLSVNQIYILRDLIEVKRDQWSAEHAEQNHVFLEFCKSALKSAKWEPGWEWSDGKLEQWTQYAVSGILTDVIELHLHIMKVEETTS